VRGADIADLAGLNEQLISGRGAGARRRDPVLGLTDEQYLYLSSRAADLDLSVVENRPERTATAAKICSKCRTWAPYEGGTTRWRRIPQPGSPIYPDPEGQPPGWYVIDHGPNRPRKLWQGWPHPKDRP